MEYNLNVKDKNGFSAAMHLVRANDVESCNFLANHPVINKEDFICGGAFANNKVLCDAFTKKMNEQQLAFNYGRIAGYAAQGGHQELAEYFLNRKPKKQRDYNGVATEAARGGHQALANVYRNKSKPSAPASPPPVLSAPELMKPTLSSQTAFRPGVASENPPLVFSPNPLPLPRTPLSNPPAPVAAALNISLPMTISEDQSDDSQRFKLKIIELEDKNRVLEAKLETMTKQLESKTRAYDELKGLLPDASAANKRQRLG